MTQYQIMIYATIVIIVIGIINFIVIVIVYCYCYCLLLLLLFTLGGGTLVYKVFFMKKLWVNTGIGKDRKSDIMFHYHQVRHLYNY